MILLLLIFFLLWSIVGTILGFLLKLFFKILPIKLILTICLIGFGLNLLGIYIL